jgi:hypothetical protein
MTRDELVALARKSGAFSFTEPEVGIQNRRREVFEFSIQALERFAKALAASETLAERPGYVCASPLLYQHTPQQPDGGVL